VTLRIEPPASATADPLAELHRACFPEDPWDAEAIARIMAMPGFFGRIAWEQQIPIGFALALCPGAESEILALGVVAERRRIGIGSTLVDAICLEAQLRGVDHVLLEVAMDNAAARALYAARGFIEVSRRCNYYRRNELLVDALVLRRALETPNFST
jgi:ribosomal-protein-alanine N-acetyltransferase